MGRSDFTLKLNLIIIFTSLNIQTVTLYHLHDDRISSTMLKAKQISLTALIYDCCTVPQID